MANGPGSWTEAAVVSEARSALSQPTTARRTAALSFTLHGRATRTELASYILSAVFVTLAVSFASALAAPYAVRALVSDGLTMLLAIPVPALLVRRLHDQGRSGRLVWLAVLAFGVWLVRTVISNTLGMEARIGFDRMTWLLDWAVIFANLAAVILAILPGTAGPNRYGPDPRQRSA
ncbi:MAG: DUF805 domain-containing protein [Sphingomonadaceae bacterium]|nr:DUF805 domain-containing protein [Sphingomonadaceae bacterium]